MKKWSRQDLKKMLLHNFSGTIADNVIEIGWILCFSLIADKSFVERITTMMGLNDAFWVVLSSTYYTTRTAMTALLPKSLVVEGKSVESKMVKNFVYLFYLMLLPVSITSFFYMRRLLTLMGVNAIDLDLYVNYFRMSVISIMIAAPWAVMVPSYYRSKGQSDIAHKLDHAIAWSMIIGIFVTTHIFKLGVLWALVVNMISNALPLMWFIYDKPIDSFWSKGFEFSFSEIKRYWYIVKWELIRRLSPRVTNLMGFSIVLTVNPIYLAVKYWVSNLAMMLEGWVDASAGLLNSHVSRNHGFKLVDEIKDEPYDDNEYVFKLSMIGMTLTMFVLYLIVFACLRFLPSSIYSELLNPLIYVLVFIETASKLRYYMWLSIGRGYRFDLNGQAQLIYAITTIVLTPTLMWLFLMKFSTGIVGIFAVGAVVGFLQMLLTEIYFRRKL